MKIRYKTPREPAVYAGSRHFTTTEYAKTNNMALIARGYPTTKVSNDLLIMLFNELMEKYPEYKEYIPTVTEQMVKKVINKLNMKVNSQVIVDFIMNRYQAIK